MDIPTANLSVPINATPLKVAEVALPSRTASTETNTSVQPALDTASPAIYPTTNPTYDRPIASINALTVADQSGQPVTPNQSATNEATDTIPDIVPDTDSEPDDAAESQAAGDEESAEEDQQNKEIYSEAELAQISDLKARDAEVVAHERAHAVVGGQHAGSPTYSYETGPDGVKYAVSGEVSIDTSEVAGDPQATLQKAQQIKAAALAPAEPSAQDRKVATQADQMASQARNDILEENSGANESSSDSTINRKTNVPEHFTDSASLSSDENNNVQHGNIQQLMNERNEHINQVYQNSSSTILSSSFQIQV